MIAPLRKQKVECPPLLSDKTIIERVWHGSLKPGKKLPQYEDVVLGSLGRLGDHLLLIESGPDAEFKVIRAGRKIREWLGDELRNRRLCELPRDCAIALGEVIAQSIAAGVPVPYKMHRVNDGMVETYEMLAFPMDCRWGPTLVGVYVGEAGGLRYNLVDTIFRSTSEGIMALAAIRNAVGVVVDFQVVAFNDGATRLLGVEDRRCAGAVSRNCRSACPRPNSSNISSAPSRPARLTISNLPCRAARSTCSLMSASLRSATCSR